MTRSTFLGVGALHGCICPFLCHTFFLFFLRVILAKMTHPFLSQAACERTLPLSHFFRLRTSSPKPSEANELTSERANKRTSMEVVASLLPLVAVTMATD
jgi:hypothetical protein